MASSVDDLSLKDLRGLIKEAGLSSDGCIDKADLRERAKEALERLEVPGAALGPISKTLIVPQAPPAASESFISLLGEELLTKDGLKSTMALLAGKKFVMLYFSAHWSQLARGADLGPALLTRCPCADADAHVACARLSPAQQVPTMQAVHT